MRDGNWVENRLAGEEHQPLGQGTQCSLKRLARVSKNVIRCGDRLKQMRDEVRCFTASFSKQRTSEKPRRLGEVGEGGECVMLEILTAGEADATT